jgi:hypothetical protein
MASLPAPGVKEAGLSHDLSRTVYRESRLVVRPEFQVPALPLALCLSLPSRHHLPFTPYLAPRVLLPLLLAPRVAYNSLCL